MEKQPNIFDELGLSGERKFVDGPAPRSVDLDVLRAYHRGELPESEAEDIDFLTALFRDWQKASDDVLMELGHALTTVAATEPIRKSLNAGFSHLPHESFWSRRKITVSVAAASLALIIGTMVFFRNRDPLANMAAVPQRFRDEVAAMLASTTVTVPKTVADRVFSGTRGGSEKSMYVRPRGTFIQEDRPTFKWQVRSADDRYQVVVYRPQNTDPIMSPIVSESQWQVPTPLIRGVDYAWDVKTIRGSETLLSDEPQARFVILDQGALTEVRLALGESSSSSLSQVAVLLQFGLLDDAEDVLETTVKKYPGSEIGKKLLENLRLQR